MQILSITTALIILYSVAHGQSVSAGACGPTSVANVLGCWGTPGCAYNIAKDLGPGAACLYDYCNCGGVAVPLLSTTISETATVGCGGYTIQPTAKNCPTGPPASVSNPPTATQLQRLTSFAQNTLLTVNITTTVLDVQSSPVTAIIGPSGVAWAPFSHVSSLPNVSVPSVQPSVPSAPSGSSSAVVPPPGSSVPLPSGGTVVIGSVGSQVTTETFVPTIISGYTTLVTTITNVISSSMTEVIGPGGIVWTPLSQPPSDAPEMPPPSVLPSNPSVPPSSSLPSRTLPSGVPSVTGASVQSSVTDAFDHVSQSQTSLIINGVTEYYSKETFSDLATITAPTTVTTLVVQTNDDGSQHTVSAGIVIVGPGGSWWNGGTGGLSLHGPSCIWPFCPPGGGGDVIGGGSQSNPKDPNTPESNEKPNSPESLSNSRPSSSASSTFCSSTAVASDCSVLCSSTQSGASTSQPCSTTCYLTITGCSPTGMTVTTTTSTATAQLCSLACSSCKVNNIPAATYAAAKRDVNDRRDGLEVRRLNEPSDPQYSGNVEAFLLSEYSWAEWVPHIDGSSALARQLGNQRKDLAVHGLYGCTSVIVVSNQGIWISHFWEVPSFQFQQLFHIEVLDQMRNGDGTPEMPVILQYTNPGGQFEGLQRPHAIIVTPQVRGSRIPGDLLYRPMVDQIEALLLQMMPSSNPMVIDYQPNSDPEAQLSTSTGKILVQYDPAQAFLSNPKNRCQTGQQTMIRIWVENKPLWVYQLYWLAETNQLVQQPQKRDATCTLPLSTLPQTVNAATESQGSVMGTLIPSASVSPSSAPMSSSANAITDVSTTILSPTTTTSPPTTSAPSSGTSSGSCPPASPSAGAPQDPGCWGTPGCAYYLAAEQGLPPDTPDYCNCGNITAPLLTHGGKTDCAYSTQPASNTPLETLTSVLASTSNRPASPSTNIAPTAPPPPYVTGRCNIHVWEGLGQQLGQKDVYLDVKITDANGAVIGFGHDGIQWAKSLNVDSKLANVMVLTPQTGLKNKIKRATDPLFGADAEGSRRSYPLGKRLGAPPPSRPLNEKGPLDFAIGGQSWDTTFSQCSVGKYDNGNAKDFFGSLIFGDNFIPGRQIDCNFDC